MAKVKAAAEDRLIEAVVVFVVCYLRQAAQEAISEAAPNSAVLRRFVTALEEELASKGWADVSMDEASVLLHTRRKESACGARRAYTLCALYAAERWGQRIRLGRITKGPVPGWPTGDIFVVSGVRTFRDLAEQTRRATELRRTLYTKAH